MKASKHRPTVATVDLDAIAFNVQQVSRHIPSQTLKYAVMKANAYGHGVAAVTKKLAAQVDGFCVSNMDEALEIREEGLDHPILILGVVPTETVDLAKKYDIRLTVASLAWLKHLLAEEPDFSGLKVHIKVDSGMGRIGFRKIEEIKEAEGLLLAAGAEIEGIFTHFATADEADDRKFQDQYHFFKEVLAALESLPPIVHASNSATSLWHADTIFTAVRLGDVMYGLNPSGSVLALPYEIKPALSLVSKLVHVKQLEAGQDIGYGATYTTEEPQWIGTIPIGYADGWIREMQNFHVLINGEFCPIVGRVSMDQVTVRLPHEFPLGTKVTLIGRDGEKEITATEVADYRGTINYEVVCLLSDRIPRDYTGEE